MTDTQVAVAGDINADVILTGADSFPEWGKEVRADDMTFTLGGASAIFASFLSHLGPDVSFHAAVGNDDVGHMVLKHLTEAGVQTSGVQIEDEMQTGMTVAVSDADEYSMVTYPGSLEEWSFEDLNMSAVTDQEHLHFASYYLQPGVQPYCPRLFRQAKDAGMSTSLDPGWDPSEQWTDDIYDVLEHVDVLLLNESEACRIADKKRLEDALHRLSDHCSLVVATRGANGAVTRSDSLCIQTGSFDVDAVDTTGAGDSFNAGFLYRWLDDASLETCLSFATAAAALSTREAGGVSSAPRSEEVEAFLAQQDELEFIPSET